MVHHLFDAGWSVPIRRFCEHIAALLFPVDGAALHPDRAAGAKRIYPWMSLDPHADHALHAKQPLFTMPVFYVVAAALLPGLVAALQPAALLVAQAGRDRRRRCHLQDAVLLLRRASSSSRSR